MRCSNHKTYLYSTNVYRYLSIKLFANLVFFDKSAKFPNTPIWETQTHKSTWSIRWCRLCAILWGWQLVDIGNFTFVMRKKDWLAGKLNCSVALQHIYSPQNKYNNTYPQRKASRVEPHARKVSCRAGQPSGLGWQCRVSAGTGGVERAAAVVARSRATLALSVPYETRLRARVPAPRVTGV